jgi:hypothetical protein
LPGDKVGDIRIHRVTWTWLMRDSNVGKREISIKVEFFSSVYSLRQDWKILLSVEHCWRPQNTVEDVSWLVWQVQR